MAGVDTGIVTQVNGDGPTARRTCRSQPATAGPVIRRFAKPLYPLPVQPVMPPEDPDDRMETPQALRARAERIREVARQFEGDARERMEALADELTARADLLDKGEQGSGG